MTDRIPNQDLPLLRQVVRPAILLVLLVRLGELPSAYQTAAMLGIDRRTVAGYLKDLTRLGLIQRHLPTNGYRLAEPLSTEHRRLLAIFDPAWRGNK